MKFSDRISINLKILTCKSSLKTSQLKLYMIDIYLWIWSDTWLKCIWKYIEDTQILWNLTHVLVRKRMTAEFNSR